MGMIGCSMFFMGELQQEYDTLETESKSPNQTNELRHRKRLRFVCRLPVPFQSHACPDGSNRSIVDSHQPGWVECEFVDAEGRRHLIIEKVPVVTAEDLDADSEYPKSGTVRCEIVKRYAKKGRN